MIFSSFISKMPFSVAKSQQFLLAWTVIALSLTLIDGQCPDSSWQYYSGTGSCYYVSTFDEQHQVATERCTSRGATLVSIGGENEWIYIRDQLIKNRTDYWMGLTKVRGEPARGIKTGYGWVDGRTSYSTSWEKWYTNTEFSGDNEPSGDADCTRIRSDGYWADIHCDQYYRYICERSAVAPTTTTTSTTTTTTTRPPTTPSTTRPTPSTAPRTNPPISFFTTRPTAPPTPPPTVAPSVIPSVVPSVIPSVAPSVTPGPSSPRPTNPIDPTPDNRQTAAPSSGDDDDDSSIDVMLLVGLVILAVQVLITATICLVVLIKRNRRNKRSGVGGKGDASSEKTGGFDAPSIASSSDKVNRSPDPMDGPNRSSYLDPSDVARLQRPDTEVSSISENMNNLNNKKGKKKNKKKLKEKDIQAFARGGSDPGYDGPQDAHDPDLLPYDKSKIEDDAHDMYMY